MKSISKVIFPAALSLSVNAWAVVKPAKLQRMILEINGERVLADAQEKISVVWGDELIVSDAVVEGATHPIINFIGFPNKSAKSPTQDLKFKIATHKDLLKKWAKNEAGTLYEIRAMRDEDYAGSVFVELIKPRLDYVVLSVNGAERVLREGNILSVSGTDRFKVKKIVTNINKLDSGVTFRLMPVKLDSVLEGGEGESAYKLYELVFYRFDQEFSRIPIHIKS